MNIVIVIDTYKQGSISEFKCYIRRVKYVDEVERNDEGRNVSFHDSKGKVDPTSTPR